MSSFKLKKLAADNVRLLSADGVQQANSGHPGMPMGCADFAFTLWYKYMKHNPMNPSWIGRDRYVQSAGHGSMLVYSLLHLFEYGLPLDELKKFRQWGSLTPGHPEYGHTKGIEITTGPLGSGLASAVGMAMEAKRFMASTGLDKSQLFDDRKIYVVAGDGCLMEGCSHEASALAGHLKLDNIVLFYDSNSITIEGATSLACSDNTEERFNAYGWRVLKIENANCIENVEQVMDKAVISDGRPTIIIGKTTIGFGSPNKAGTNSVHGEPLGKEELSLTKKNLGFPDEMFYINPEVKKLCSDRVTELQKQAAEWDRRYNSFLEKNQKAAELISTLYHKPIPKNLLSELLKAAPIDKPNATRASGSQILQKAAELIPALEGGAADLAPSTKTHVKASGDFECNSYAGKNYHFGIRELGMGLAANGMALYGTSIPYTSTFLVFSDYMKPAIRLAAIQGLHTIYVFTHDSVMVGEDGPTHQPIEQLMMLRSIPNVTVLRPAEAVETAHAWDMALKAKNPVAIVLTRQNLKPFNSEQAAKVDFSKGAYILETDSKPDIVLIATGSEVELALEASALLKKEGFKTRVVSMPSMETFLKQDKNIKEAIIPSTISKKVSIEMGRTLGWREIVGDNGLMIGIDHFGTSAPAERIKSEYGFVPDKVVSKIKEFYKI